MGCNGGSSPAPQTGTGGTITLGLWYLTSWQTFTGPGGATGPTGNTRKTAFFFYDGTRYVLQDAGSRNGVFVNNNKVQRQPLNSGDYVQLGTTRILVNLG